MKDKKYFIVQESEEEDYEPPTLFILALVAFIGLTIFFFWLLGGSW